MWTAQSAALAMGLALSGCGGAGGSGVASVSTPPPASYTKIVDMSGDRTFQTAGVQYSLTSATSGFTNGTSLALGSGMTVAYTAASDTYKVTAPDGSTQSFGPADVAPSPPPNAPPPLPNSQQWLKVTGGMRDSLTITVPTGTGVALSYTLFGSWVRSDTNGSTVRIALGGVPTVDSDMPRTGTATYAIATGGAATQRPLNYTLNGNSSATFSANFATNSVTTSLTLGGTTPANGTAVTSLGTYSGTGAISSTGPGFAGTLSGNGASGIFSGSFFGPKALEVGYAWYLSGGDFSAVGAATGIKQ